MENESSNYGKSGSPREHGIPDGITSHEVEELYTPMRFQCRNYFSFGAEHHTLSAEGSSKSNEICNLPAEESQEPQEVAESDKTRECVTSYEESEIPLPAPKGVESLQCDVQHAQFGKDKSECDTDLKDLANSSFSLDDHLTDADSDDQVHLYETITSEDISQSISKIGYSLAPLPESLLRVALNCHDAESADFNSNSSCYSVIPRETATIHKKETQKFVDLEDFVSSSKVSFESMLSPRRPKRKNVEKDISFPIRRSSTSSTEADEETLLHLGSHKESQIPSADSSILNETSVDSSNLNETSDVHVSNSEGTIDENQPSCSTPKIVRLSKSFEERNICPSELETLSANKKEACLPAIRQLYDSQYGDPTSQPSRELEVFPLPDSINNFSDSTKSSSSEETMQGVRGDHVFERIEIVPEMRDMTIIETQPLLMSSESETPSCTSQHKDSTRRNEDHAPTHTLQKTENLAKEDGITPTNKVVETDELPTSIEQTQHYVPESEIRRKEETTIMKSVSELSTEDRATAASIDRTEILEEDSLCVVKHTLLIDDHCKSDHNENPGCNWRNPNSPSETVFCDRIPISDKEQRISCFSPVSSSLDNRALQETSNQDVDSSVKPFASLEEVVSTENSDVSSHVDGQQNIEIEEGEIIDNIVVAENPDISYCSNSTSTNKEKLPANNADDYLVSTKADNKLDNNLTVTSISGNPAEPFSELSVSTSSIITSDNSEFHEPGDRTSISDLAEANPSEPLRVKKDERHGKKQISRASLRRTQKRKRLQLSPPCNSHYMTRSKMRRIMMTTLRNIPEVAKTKSKDKKCGSSSGAGTPSKH